MKKNTCALTALFVLLLFCSCKKDDVASSGSALVGNWKFVSLHAKTQSTVQYVITPVTYKAVTFSDYITTNNAGNLTITESTINGNNFSYSAAINPTVYEYVDNDLLDSVSTGPINVDLPPINSTSSYEVVSQDSIHILSGTLLGSSGNGSPTNNGAKFSISGNTLILTMSVVKDSSFLYGSFPATEHERGDIDITLQRQ